MPEKDLIGLAFCGSTTSLFAVVFEDETDMCKLSNLSYQAEPVAPATCNDVLSLGFCFVPRK